MALFNVLAKSEGAINWDNVLSRYADLHLIYVEIFPIPKELGFDYDSIGINVHKGYDDKTAVLEELKLVIDFFSSYNLRFTELYDGIEIFFGNVGAIADKLLPNSRSA